MTKQSVILAGLLAAGLLPPVPAALAQDKPAIIEKPIAPATLALDQAIALALEKSPVLGSFDSRANAATASQSEAGALPNPEISIEAENIYGDGPYDGTGNADITFGVLQLVELPGKRANRIRVAETEKAKIHYARDGARLDLIRDITVAYAELAAAQRDLEVIEQERALADEVRNSVLAKVDAGKEPPIQKNKANIEWSASGIALDRARRALNTKKRMLETLMGGNTGDFIIDPQSMPSLDDPEPIDVYFSRLPQTPDVQGLEADIAKAQSNLSLEKANAFPDPTLDFGIRQFREDDSQAFVAGVSFPLPVFNLNRAGIARAGHELNAARLDQYGGRLSLESQLAAHYEEFVSAYREATALNNSVLPGAEEAFSFSRQGYDAGKFGYLDVLDAQRTLFQARRQANAAILDYHRARAVLERMTAQHAHETDKEATP